MNFTKTNIYQRALDLVSLSKQTIKEFPVGCGFLADQLRRASSSVVLNFAEGYDKGSITEQRKFYRIARGSAQEVMAIFDVANRLEAIDKTRYFQGRELCDHIVRMLYKFRQ